MRQQEAVAYRVFHDDCAEAAATGINGGGPNAAAGGCASYDNSVDLLRDHSARQIGTEEARRIFLDDNLICRELAKPWVELDPMTAVEDAVVIYLKLPRTSLEQCLVVGGGYQEDGNTDLPGTIKDFARSCYRIVEINAPHRGVWICEPFDEVDYDHCGSASETDTLGKALRSHSLGKAIVNLDDLFLQLIKRWNGSVHFPVRNYGMRMILPVVFRPSMA
jgi:hypothetical protein